MWKLLVSLLGVVGAKPHILFLLADDLGWANIGFHRQEAATADEKQGQLEAAGVLNPIRSYWKFKGRRVKPSMS